MDTIPSTSFDFYDLLMDLAPLILLYYAHYFAGQGRLLIIIIPLVLLDFLSWSACILTISVWIGSIDL
ncbi:hypothetical protein FA15DRAFT_675998 [Coprinopsis marcescibilis]|uniref:Uncharacterized protein n=1 Tax=Coprinopsis marcescibilis TaxID=230819 RepID=A0A5C3KC32_COPMA|nr:hypothetical protein FA15DRAFT_675998 [Coprinopsis marcescibilis]